MKVFEYRAEKIETDRYSFRGFQTKLNEWGQEGWEIISVIVPQAANYTFLVTAKREIVSERALNVGRKFR